MGIVFSNALALAIWRGIRLLDGEITQRDIEWLLIGAALAALVMWVVARRRRRWF